MEQKSREKEQKPQHINHHKARVWAFENPHRTKPRAAKQRFSVSFWADILAHYIIGPRHLHSPLDSKAHLIFLQHSCPSFLTLHMFLRRSVAPCGTTWSSSTLRNSRQRKIPQRNPFGQWWIGRSDRPASLAC
ncbi:hypothetical protein TNCV_3085261 [Trichonephila clavipes]|nr:hypothetical protein TNCV_3085261 [Trichonephila clavipes]